MIHVDNKPILDINTSMSEHLKGLKTKKDKIERAIDVAKSLPINGCITGSCFLPGFDPDEWGSIPDVDVFVYSEYDLIKAINIAEHCLKMKPGKGSDISEKQERWKIDRLYQSGTNKKFGITTYSFESDGIILNFTYKMKKLVDRFVPVSSAPDVLMSFDMSIVMQGYDIATRVMFDLRPDDVLVTTAVPNPLRRKDCMTWTVAKWIRQFDRVVKYYDRGFDTRPMAQFYIDMIDDCIEQGVIFESCREDTESAFTEFSEARNVISDWLEAHKED